MKRSVRILLIVAAVIVTIAASISIVLNSSTVQTKIVHALTDYLSEHLSTEVEIAHFEYEFPGYLHLDDIYIADQRQDTLIYIEHVVVRFRLFDFFKQNITVNNVELRNARGNIYRDIDGEMNYAFLASAFESNSESESTPPIVQVKNVWLNNLQFAYNDYEIQNDSLKSGMGMFDAKHIYIDSIDTKLALNYLSVDSINAEIQSFFLRERSGLQIDNIEAALVVTDREAYMPKMSIRLPHSEIATSVVHAYFPEDDTIYVGDIRTNLRIDNAYLVMRDLAPLLPALGKLDTPIRMQAQVEGAIDSVKATNLKLSYGNYTLLSGNISTHGLPDLDSTFISATLQDLNISHAALQDFISDMNDRPYIAPDLLKRLGKVHYHGQLRGMTNNMKLVGALTTQLGKVTTNGLLDIKTKNLLSQVKLEDNEHITDTIKLHDFAFNGEVTTNEFKLGELLADDQLGDIAFHVNLNGNYSEQHKELEGEVDAMIHNIEYRQYKYNNINIKGFYGEEGFRGKLNINDQHVGLNFDGLADFNAAIPTFNGTIDLTRLHLDQINLAPTLVDADLRFHTDINFEASTLDNANGSISIDTLTFCNIGKELKMRSLIFTASTPDKSTNGKRQLKLNSDYINAGCTGDFSFQTLATSVKHLVAEHLPGILNIEDSSKKINNNYSNQLDFYLYTHNINQITDVLDFDMHVDEMSAVKASLNDSAHIINLQAYIPHLRYKNNLITDIAFNADNLNDQLTAKLYAYKHEGKSPAAQALGNLHLNLNTFAKNDSLWLDFLWENRDNGRNKGKLSTASTITTDHNDVVYNLSFLPSDILLNDSLWSMNQSHVSFNPKKQVLDIEHFSLGTVFQGIAADGRASRQNSDSLYVALSNLNLDYLLLFTDVGETISFGGDIDGWAKVYSLFSSPMFEADVVMDSALINSSLLGDVHATATLDREKQTIIIDGNVVENNRRVAHVDGEVVPATEYWGIDIDVDSANLAFINYWTKDILSDIKGRGFGHIKVYGEGPITYVVGKALGKDAQLGIPMIGAHFTFTDSVIMEKTAIRFPNITLRDDEGNPMTLNGTLTHFNFKDFKYDLQAQVMGTHAVHLPASNKELFYGDAYANGTISILGDEQQCNISVRAQTQPKTDFTLSVVTATTATDNSFVHFVSDIPVTTKKDNKIVITGPTDTRINLTLEAEVDDDALFNLLVTKSGDMLKARGNGALQVNYDSQNDEARVFGTYVISSGTFDFTLQNLIHRSFSFRQGSQIVFNGDPENPQINATAVYSTTASLRDLFGSDYTNVATSRTSIPVNCLLTMTGNLNNPTIKFGIELPQSDESVASQVSSIINTEEILMREIMYLLAFNRFYTPDFMQSTTTVGLNETYSLLTSTVTGQINNWISKLTDNFTVGFNIRTDGEGSSAQQEYETQFQIQPTTRLLINGNVGYRYNDFTNRPVFGNLDVEYMLTQSGQWRAKAYTHTVDRYSLREATTIQGVGLKFQQDFNQGDAKKNREARRKRREERKSEPKKKNTNINMHKGR